MKMGRNYTIGLDIGTNSVGYAVVLDNHKLVSKKMKINGSTEKKSVKKNFWGSRIFEEGKTAEDTRLSRTTRRRYARRRNRLVELQKIFEEEMSVVDNHFFMRLEESFLTPEDKKVEKYPIFGTIEEEKTYHKTYPTIYHLRKFLSDTPEKADLRLVYLACAHILKFRGHFLIEGDLDTSNNSVNALFSKVIQDYNSYIALQEDGSILNPLIESLDIESIIMSKISKSRKVENILALYPGEPRNGTFMQILKVALGLKGNFKKTFDSEEKLELEIPKDSYEEDLSFLLEQIGDEYANLFLSIKNLYDAIVLSGILVPSEEETNAKLSISMIKRYEEHKRDLQKLKKYIKVHLPEEYTEIFKDVTKNGYAGYIAGKTTQLEFYSYMKKKIQGLKDADGFINKIDQEDFLRKQRTFDNGAIPHQIHLQELKEILKNQSTYYPKLAFDSQKIIDIFTFRIPYYIGPLGKGNSRFEWIKRYSNEPIKPWNIREIVDFEASATEFIDKMTNFDTYLPNEKVLPKSSLIYQEYMIFNELTKVRYLDDQGKIQNFSSIEKQEIFDKLFKVDRKVTKIKLEKFLQDEYHQISPTVQGLEKSFNASFSTYHDLSKIKGMKEVIDNPENTEMLEDIVKSITIFEDQKMIENQLSQYEEILDRKIIKDLARKKYTGWGRLSRKLIDGIRDQNTGKTILDFLKSDDGDTKNINRNFMQLINDDVLSFKEFIQKEQFISNDQSITDVVQNLAGSPAIKKGILQSVKIVDELIGIMGYLPKNIVVEMARENQTTAQGKDKSKQRLKTLEEAIKNLGSDILKENPIENHDLRMDRVYLYYLQNGRDMYTGEELELHNLSSYDIDHIIPQSFIVDNSLENRVLVNSASNRGKSDNVPTLEVVQKMESFWQNLLKAKLITQRKFDNLTKIRRGGLTEDDKANFIQRQLVETRQITKHVAQILDARFNTKKDQENQIIREVNVITLKSSLVSQFRKQFDIHKVREINDYHHGQDAYLNSVVANTLLAAYPRLKPEFIYGEYKNYNSFKENKATAKKEFYSNVMRFFIKDEPVINEDGEIIWNKATDIPTIKKVIGSRQMNIVKKVERRKGGFSNETIKPKGNSSKLIPRKTKDINLDPKKYGGHDTPLISYSVAFTYEKGKNKKIDKKIIGISVMNSPKFEKDMVGYLMQEGYSNPRVEAILPMYTLYEMPNGKRRMVSGEAEAQKANQLVLPEYLISLMYHSKRYNEVTHAESYDYVNNHIAQFDDILEIVNQFSEKFIVAEKRLEEINKLYIRKEVHTTEELAKSFIELMKFISRGAPTSFVFLGKQIDRNRYRSIIEIWDATIIHQSVTGLYETRIKLGE